MAETAKIITKSKYSFYPLTKSNGKDFENLFGENGACAGCWCMYWRERRKTYEQNKGAGNRKAFKIFVDKKQPTGIIAYDKNEPVGWCSVAPREDFLVLDNSRILKRIDDKPVWSVVCFFIKRGFRRKGVSVALLNAVKIFVKQNGGKFIEGYPIEPKKGKMPDAFAWVGLSSAFLKAGFKEIIRRSETRPIMRYRIN